MIDKADRSCVGPWCYVAALVAASAAFALRYMIFGSAEPRFPYLFALPVVVAAAGVLGTGPGILSALTSAALPTAFTMEPLRSLGVVEHVDRAAQVAFLASALLVAFVVRALIRAKLASLGAAMERQRLATQANQLLFELRHRTKNELQQIVALFHAQARVAGTATERETLKAMGHRVQAVGNIHDMVLESTMHPDDPLDTSVFLTGVVRKLRDAASDREIEWRVAVESHLVSHTVAIPLGLLVNELAGNAVKHAFGGRPGTITICFQRNGAYYELEVTDDGVGIGTVTPARPGIGQRVMRGLAANLGADTPECHLLTGGSGTRCAIRFPVHRVSSTLRREAA